MSKLTLYRYSGPFSGTSLTVDGETLDILLYPGGTVRLPAEHGFTQALLAQQRLQEVAQPAAVQSAASDATLTGKAPAATTKESKHGR